MTAGLARLLVQAIACAAACAIVALPAPSAAAARGAGRELRPVVTLAGHTDGVMAVAFSPDGKQVASAGHDGTVRLWDAETGRPVHTFHGHRAAAISVSFSRDGRRLAAGGRDRTARVWDVRSGDEVAVLAGHGHDVQVAFLPDGRLLTGARDGSLRVWDVDAEREVWRSPPDQCVLCLAVTPDGARAAYGGCDGVMRVWDLARHKTLGQLGEPVGQPCEAVALSPDGKRVYGFVRGGFVRGWDVAAARPVPPPRTAARLMLFAITADASRAVGQRGDVIDLDSGKPLFDLAGSYRTSQALVHALAFSPDGTRVAIGGGGMGHDETNSWRPGRRNVVDLFHLPAAATAEPRPAAGAASRVSWDVIRYEVRKASAEATPAPAGGADWAVSDPQAWHAASGPLAAGDESGGAEARAGMDVLWSAKAVLVHHRRGILREAMTDHLGGFTDVAWDGRNVWVASTTESGVIVLNPQGEVVARVGRGRGLPSCGRGLILHALSPGRVLAAGCEEEAKGGGWCAVLERNTGNAGNARDAGAGRTTAPATAAAAPSGEAAGRVDVRVNVFVREDQLKALKDGWGDDFEGNKVTVTAFSPDWFTDPPTTDTGGEREVWLVCAAVPRSPSPVLRINPRTLAFASYNLTPRQFENDRTRLHAADSLGAGPGYLFWTGGREFITTNSTPSYAHRAGPERVELGDRRPVFFAPDADVPGLWSGGTIYLPGNDWYRIDPRKPDLPQSDPRQRDPRQREGTTYAVRHLGPGLRDQDGALLGKQVLYFTSAHLGPAAFSPTEGCFYKISVDPAHPLANRAAPRPPPPPPAPEPVSPGTVLYSDGQVIFRAGLGAVAFRDGRLQPLPPLLPPSEPAVRAAEWQKGFGRALCAQIGYRLEMSAAERERLGLTPEQFARIPRQLPAIPVPAKPKLEKLYEAWSATPDGPQKDRAAEPLFAEARTLGDACAKDTADYLTQFRACFTDRQWKMIQYEEPGEEEEGSTP